MSSEKTRELLRAWGCPTDYCLPTSDYQGYYAPEPIRAASAVINGYCEHDDALQTMWDAGDVDAVREWAKADVWETIGQETSSDGEAGSYPEDVRESLAAMAEAMENQNSPAAG